MTGGDPTPFYEAADYDPGITPTTCTIPGGSTILNNSAELATYQVQVDVPPQVFNRNTAQAVYCSCRCANVSGYPVDPTGTPDDAVYCTCPDDFTCTQLVTSIGSTFDQGLTGRYCMKTGTGYEPASTTCESDPPAGRANEGCCKVPGTCCQPYGTSCGSTDNDSCHCN